jgi:cyclohexanone monooxygenase
MIANGKSYDVDCVVFATGFEHGIAYTRLTGFELYGRDGIALSEHWTGGTRTLHGLSTDKFPNCFFVGGNQHSAQAHNAVHLLDEQAEHLRYIFQEIRERGIKTVEPSVAAVDEYSRAIREAPGSDDVTAFFLACTPGYFNAEGKAKKNDELFGGARYGEGAMAFFRMLDGWRKAGTLDGLELQDDGETPAK